MPDESSKSSPGPQASLVYMLLAVIAGGSSSVGLRIVDPPRDDPFTGKDGDRLEEHLLFRIGEEVKDREVQYVEMVRRLEEHKADCILRNKLLIERLDNVTAERVEWRYNQRDFNNSGKE